jgi:hypothetical protein
MPGRRSIPVVLSLCALAHPVQAQDLSPAAAQPPITIRNIVISGTRELSEETVRQAVPVEVGAPTSEPLEHIRDAVERRYREAGFTFARVTPIFDAATATLSLTVDEGVIDGVEFHGVDDSNVVRTFLRFARAVSGREISIGDSAGATRTYPAVPNPMTLSVELGQSARITATSRYYLRIMATAGTLAEREADDVGDAVFGRASETTGLGSLGRMVLRTMIKVSDYLQSVSAETTGRRISGAELLMP